MAALDAIDDHMGRGDLEDGLIFDAVRVRLIEIGEAVKAIPPQVLLSEADLPWGQMARMRDQLAHHYDTTHAVVAATVRGDVMLLRAAVERLLSVVD